MGRNTKNDKYVKNNKSYSEQQNDDKAIHFKENYEGYYK
jgi:hypothetical protein